jgi:hypothetical protein
MPACRGLDFAPDTEGLGSFTYAMAHGNIPIYASDLKNTEVCVIPLQDDHRPVLLSPLTLYDLQTHARAHTHLQAWLKKENYVFGMRQFKDIPEGIMASHICTSSVLAPSLPPLDRF